MNPVSEEHGQVMVELLAVIISVVVTFTFGGWYLKVAWDRGKCAYIVFETTHAQVTHAPAPAAPPWFSSPVEIRDLPESVQGTSQCGQSSESVFLPKLDPLDPVSLPDGLEDSLEDDS